MTNAIEITGHELDTLLEKHAELVHETLKSFAANFTEQEKKALTQVAKESEFFREKVTDNWDSVETMSEFDRGTAVLMYEHAFINILDDERRARDDEERRAREDAEEAETK